MRRMAVVVVITLLLVACASGGGSTAPRVPQVDIEQLSTVARNVRSTSGLPVDFRVTVHNPLDHPVTLTALEIETVGASGAYRMKRVRHKFETPIGPQATETIELRAWVTPLQLDEVGEVKGPVSVRGLARFSTANGPLQTTFSDRVQ